MKKTVKGLIAALLVALLLVGCGDKAAEQNAPTTGSVESTSVEEKQETTSSEDVTASVEESTTEESSVEAESESAPVVESKTEEESAPAEESTTEEPAAEPEQEIIDISKLVKKKIEYYNEDGSYYREYIYTYNEAGLLVKEEMKDSELVSEGVEEPDTVEYIYDESGNLVQEIRNVWAEDYFGEYVKYTYITTYNAAGNKLKYEFKDSVLNTEGNVTDYIYDAAGYLVEQYERGYSEWGDEINRHTYYENDDHGNLVKKVIEDGYGNRIEDYTYKQYEYNADGTLKKETAYVAESGELQSVTEYDENGFRCYYEYWSSGKCCAKENTKYNINGDLVRSQRYEKSYNVNDTSGELYLIREYVVSEEDNTATDTYYNTDGSVKSTETKMWNKEVPEYDEAGTMVSMKSWSGALTGYGSDFYDLHTYEYDEAGNLVKETCNSYYFDYNGKVTSWVEYYY